MCILQNESQFLLLKRGNEPNKGKYVPVGGKLEPFESPAKAVRRETKEETGLSPKHFTFCGTLIESSPTTYNWMCYIYKAEIDYVFPPFCDEGSLEWIHYDDLLNIPTPATDWCIYQYAVENRPFAFSAEFNEKLEMTEMIEEIQGIKVF